MASVIWHGITEAKGALDAMSARMEAATQRATREALHLIERRTKEKLAEKTHQRGTPTPSGAGEPPALITGNLRRSIRVSGPEREMEGWRGHVGPTAAYGRAQELGGGPRNLPARPYLRPSLDELKPEIAEIFRAAWASAILG